MRFVLNKEFIELHLHCPFDRKHYRCWGRSIIDDPLRKGVIWPVDDDNHTIEIDSNILADRTILDHTFREVLWQFDTLEELVLECQTNIPNVHRLCRPFKKCRICTGVMQISEVEFEMVHLNVIQARIFSSHFYRKMITKLIIGKGAVLGLYGPDYQSFHLENMFRYDLPELEELIIEAITSSDRLHHMVVFREALTFAAPINLAVKVTGAINIEDDYDYERDTPHTLEAWVTIFMEAISTCRSRLQTLKINKIDFGFHNEGRLPMSLQNETTSCRNLISLAITNTIQSGVVVRDIVRVLRTHYGQLQFLDLSSAITEFDIGDLADVATDIGGMPSLRTFLLKDANTVKDRRAGGSWTYWDDETDGEEEIEAAHERIRENFAGSVLRSTTLSRLQLKFHFADYKLGYYAARNRCWRSLWTTLPKNNEPDAIWPYVMSQPDRWLRWWKHNREMVYRGTCEESEELIQTPTAGDECYDTYNYLDSGDYVNWNSKDLTFWTKCQADAIFSLLSERPDIACHV